jgi:hypothetical protein
MVSDYESYRGITNKFHQRLADYAIVIPEPKKGMHAEEAGTSVTFLLPYSLAYSGDRTA